MAADGFSSDEARVRREFWPTLRRVARSIPFAEDAVAAYYCALDRETPTHVRAALIGAHEVHRVGRSRRNRNSLSGLSQGD